MATTTAAILGSSSATRVTETPRDAPVAPGPWQDAKVTAVKPETPTAKTFRLSLERPTPYLAGQHFIVRLTAPDGYSASRSYSVASAPVDDEEIELTVERLPGGEVSMFVHDEVVVGDELEVRGPVGGWFVWRGDTPALLVGGGSGVVPLMAMLRLARKQKSGPAVRLAVSVRSPEFLYYADELPGPETTVFYTRESPPESARPVGRLSENDLAPLLKPDDAVFICGSSPFADAVAKLVMTNGASLDRIRIERFGPSG